MNDNSADVREETDPGSTSRLSWFARITPTLRTAQDWLQRKVKAKFNQRSDSVGTPTDSELATGKCSA